MLTPFLMLTAKDAPADRIQALDEGVDDCVIKTFDYGELLARLRALLRRPSGERSPVLRCGPLRSGLHGSMRTQRLHSMRKLM